MENKGIASRDFIYVEDIVEGLILCALGGAPGEVYNLASGVETSIMELAELINQLTGNHSPVKYLPGRDWDRSGRRLGCIEKSREQLGFQTQTTLQDGLKKTIKWTKTHLDFIDKTIRKHDHFQSLL